MDEFVLPSLSDIPPFPGLRPFTRAEAPIFFGRDRCIDGMMATLQAQRFLAVLGPSGSGKSSLVRSGLFPNLEAGLARRAGSRWTFLDIRHPRLRPYRALARATLVEEIRRLDGRTFVPDDRTINQRQDELAQSPMELVRWWARQPRQDGEKLLLLIDQFEELFGFESARDRQEVETFVDLLLYLAAEPEQPIYVVLTMRSEFLGGCSLFPGFAEQINRAINLTPRMSRSECEVAITGPAYNRPDFVIEPLVVTTILNDMNTLAAFDRQSDEVAKAAGTEGVDQGKADSRQADLIASRADQLPLMSHVLNWLWNRALARQSPLDAEGRAIISLEDYLAVDGLSGALSRHANEMLGDDPDDILIAERLFRAITDQPSIASGSAETSAVRRPRRLEQIAHETGIEVARLVPLIERLRADGISLLTPDPSEVLSSETEIDISHESIIRQWNRLSVWIRAEADGGRGWQELMRSRQEEGRRGVLRGIDLQDRREWWKRNAPRAGWAERYGGGHAEASAFLARSEKRSGLRKATLYGGTAALVIAAVFSGGVLVRTQALVRDAETELTRLTEESQVKLAAAESSMQAARGKEVDARKQAVAATKEKEQAFAQAALAKQQIVLAQAAGEAARREKTAALAEVQRAQEQTLQTTRKARDIAGLGAFVARGAIDEAMRETPKEDMPSIKFADQLLPVLTGIDPELSGRMTQLREVARGRAAYLDLDIAGMDKAAATIEEMVRVETASDWRAAGRVEANLIRGRVAALRGDFRSADANFATSQGSVRDAGERVPAEVVEILAAERSRLVLGTAWSDIYTIAHAAQSWRDGAPDATPPDLNVLKSGNVAQRCAAPLSEEGMTSSIANGIAAENFDPANEYTFESLRKASTAPAASNESLIVSAQILCAAYVQTGAQSKERTVRNWGEISEKLTSLTSREETRIAMVALAHNSNRLMTAEEGELLVSAALSASETVRQFRTLDANADEMVLDSLDSISSGAKAISSGLTLQKLATASDLLDRANAAQKGTANSPNTQESTEELDDFRVRDLLSGLGRLRHTEREFRVSNLATSAIPFARRAASRELFRAAEHYLTALNATREFDLADLAVRSALFEAAAQSIGGHGDFMAGGTPAPDRERLVRQAGDLLKLAAGSHQDLVYRISEASLGAMVEQICPALASSECALPPDFGALLAGLPSSQLATAPWSGWVDDRGVALAGHDLVSVDTFEPFSENPEGPRVFLGGPSIGREGFSLRYPDPDGSLWLFSSEKNLELFRNNPKKYIPSIGGFDLTSLFLDEPSLTKPGVSFSMVQRGEEIFLYSFNDIDFSQIDEKAISFAKDAYEKLSKNQAVEKYTGTLPRYDAMDAATAAADAVEEAAADAAKVEN